MDIIIYSDIHSNELILLNETPDLVIISGDVDWRDVKKIDNHYKCIKVGVLGNHDKLDTFKGTDVIHLHKTVVEVDGTKIAGFDGCPVYNHKENSAQFTEGQAQLFVNKLEKVDIFVAHANPAFRYSSDLTNPHRGFHCYKDLMDKENVDFFLHGHIHENEIYEYGKTMVISTFGMRKCSVDVKNKPKR